MTQGPESRTCAFIYRWLAAVATTFALFHVFDRNHGLVRAGLLLTLAALAWRYRVRLRRLPPVTVPPERWERTAVKLATFGIAINVALGIGGTMLALETQTVPADQAQAMIDALTFLRQGINPWAADTILDHIVYPLALDELRATPACRASDQQVQFRLTNLSHETSTARTAMPPVIPPIRSSPECARLRDLFSSLGFRYGPVLVLFYWPFVAWFGAAGFPIAHLLAFAGCCGLVYSWGHDRRRRPFWAATALVPFVWSSQVTWNVLMVWHLDMLPVLLAVCALFFCERRQFGRAAACLGASVGAKFLPGLLFFPLLLKAPRRFLLLAAGIALACFAPLALWDWSGLWHNLGYPFLRQPDSTAVVFSLSAGARRAMTLVSLAGMAGLAIHAQTRGWDLTGGLDWLVGTLLLVLGTGSTLHNNYLVWLVPVMCVWVINGDGGEPRELTERQSQPCRPGTP